MKPAHATNACRTLRSGLVAAGGRWFLAAALLFCLPGRSQLACAVCGKAIQGGYLEAAGKAFCSRECFRTTLPVCATCGKRIEGGHLIHDGRHFCSEACFQRILPTCTLCGVPLQQSYTIKARTYCKAHADGPRCDACGLPVGKGYTMGDGRIVCSDCKPGLVFAVETAAPLYAKARETLVGVLGLPLPASPPLELVGSEALPAHPGLDPSIKVRELGRYLRQMETVTHRNLLGVTLREETAANRRVLVLYGLTPGRFMATAAHELTHDLLSERYPMLAEGAPDWLEEGLCQYASVLACRRLGYSECVAEIESSDDPVYGDGYRYVARRFGNDGWRSISTWLEAKGFAGLPRRPPAGLDR